MPINPNIALGFKPTYELESPQNILANVMKQKGDQQTLQMNALRMQEAQRGVESQNALNRALSTAYDPSTGRYDPSKVYGELASAGQGGLIPGQMKSEAERVEAENKSQKAQADLLGSKITLSKDVLERYVKTPDQMKQFNAANMADPVIGKYMQDRGITLQQLNDEVDSVTAAGPDAFNRYLQKQILGAKEFANQYKSTIHFPQGSNKAFTFNQGTNTITEVPGLDTGAGRVLTPAQQATQSVAEKNLALKEREVLLKEQQAASKNAETISPKEIQKREAVFPQATSSLKGFEAKTDSFISDLKKLRDHPGLNQITGLVAGRIPALTDDGRAAQALYDKVVAKGGFQALQDLREASKTGGALGNVSNQEGKQLIASFAAIDRRQNAKDVQNAIDEAISGIEGSKVRMREAYDSTYEYKNKGMEPSQGQPAAPAKSSGGVKFLGFE